MKLLLLIVGFICLVHPSSQAGELSYPKLFFNYSYLFDANCSPMNPLNPSWAKEAKARELEFTNIWENDALALMGVLLTDFNAGFRRKEYTATLSVCPRLRSYSNPLVLNITGYLKSYIQSRTRPDYAFVDLVFHELLHTWVVENRPDPSPLLEKYKNEPQTVRVHIHLMALQMYVYTKLDRQDMLQWNENKYSETKGDYQRAWEIAKSEGYMNVVAEFRKHCEESLNGNEEALP